MRLLLAFLCVALLPVIGIAKEDIDRGSAGRQQQINALSEKETGFWLNTKTGVRHNKHCKYYGKGKAGRPCKANEGVPCKICGG